MKCVKCHGLMYVERFYDYFSSCAAWHCINCGAIIDRTIAMNRRRLFPVREWCGGDKQYSKAGGSEG